MTEATNRDKVAARYPIDSYSNFTYMQQLLNWHTLLRAVTTWSCFCIHRYIWQLLHAACKKAKSKSWAKSLNSHSAKVEYWPEVINSSHSLAKMNFGWLVMCSVGDFAGHLNPRFKPKLRSQPDLQVF